jgi:hypothetical protein
MDIQMALALIEGYVESLQVWQLNEEYDKRALEMIAWLKEYGCDNAQIEIASEIVRQYTGYSLIEISSLEQAAVVKQALYGVVNSEMLGRRQKSNEVRDSVKWALDNVDFGFGGDYDPIDSCENNS